MHHMPTPARRISRRRAQCRLEEEAAGERRLHPLLRRIFENRNVRTRGELDYALNNLHAPESLKGLDAATAILHRALSERRKILIVGDYDVDGATATSVALLGLRAFGAARAGYLVPNRFQHGYGLSESIARIALQRRPDVVITVDNGISSVDGVALLRAAGVDALVIGQEGYDSQKFIEIAGKAANGVIITTSLDRDSDNAETVDFIRRFEAKAGYKVDMVAASGHTAVKALVEAMRKAGSTERDAVRRMLHEVSIEASTGTIAFNTLGEVKKDAQVQIVRDGEWRHHSVISDSVLLAPPDQ